MRLAELAQDIKCDIYLNADTDIKELTINSKQKTSRGLYFCISGTKTDGHDYISEAVANGAVAVVTSKTVDFDIPYIMVADVREALSFISAAFYQKAHEKLKVIGITGTNGKTTTSYLLKSILESAGKNVGVIGSLGAKYLDKSLSLDLTTPDPIDLHRTFLEMADAGVEYVVMEVSAHAIYLKKLAGIKMQCGIFTNLTQDHLDFFKTIENYAEVKKSFFNYKNIRKAIVNADCEIGREIISTSKVSVISYGENNCDVFATEYKQEDSGSSFVLNIRGKVALIRLQLSGKFNMYNSLAASAVADTLGINIDTIAQGISSVTCVDGRFNVIAKGGKNVIIDFAHTPEGLRNLLNAVREVYKGKIICVFGAGGNRDTTKRPKMGAVASEIADFSVLTSDNPRYENAFDIIKSIAEGFTDASEYIIEADREKAICMALDMASAIDVVVIAGKGAENYIEVKGEKIAYQDRIIVEKCLRTRE